MITKMVRQMKSRLWYLLLFLWPVGLVSYALYMQHVEFLDPCPLCILQRVAYLAAAAIALVGLIQGATGTWQRVWASLYGLSAGIGAGIAAWHVRLQHLPPDKVPDCGPGLDYMLENLPLWHVMKEVFQGSGECADIVWTFLGLSMPTWSLLMFVAMMLSSIVLFVRADSAR